MVTNRENTVEAAWTEGAAFTTASSANSGDAMTTTGTGGTRLVTALQTDMSGWVVEFSPTGTGSLGVYWAAFDGTYINYRDEWKCDGVPLAASSELVTYSDASTGTPAFRLRRATSGAIQILDYVSGTTTFATPVVGQVYYRQVCVGTDGTCQVKYTNKATGVVLADVSLTGKNFGTGNMVNIQVGKMTSGTSTYKQWLTKFAATNTTRTLLPPWSPVVESVLLWLYAADRTLQRAWIGDSTMNQGGNGYALQKASLSANGFDTTDTGTGAARKFFHYSQIGKAINYSGYMTPDAGGKTTFDNINDARAQFGGEPTGGYVFNLGGNGAPSSDAVNTARFNETMDYISSSVPVVWVGLAQRSDSAELADRLRLNTLFRALCAGRANAFWADWPTYLAMFESVNVWADSVHHNTYGYSVKNAYIPLIAPGALQEVAAVGTFWDGTNEVASALELSA